MIGAALVYRSVWILVLGAVVAALVKTVAQWRILPVHRHRLDWAPEDVHELVRFGSWIFLSTLLSFGANSAGSLVLGKLASMEKVGLFTIAATLAKASEQFYEQISQRVLFPIYATLNVDGNAAAKPRITKIRAVLVALFVPPSAWPPASARRSSTCCSTTATRAAPGCSRPSCSASCLRSSPAPCPTSCRRGTRA